MSDDMREDPQELPSQDGSLFRWGAIGTAVYLLMIAAYGIVNWPQILAMRPNEFGDLLAGVFSPIAFLWLVLGFIQQGRELSLQVAELRHSVTAQNDLVRATRDQRELEATIWREQNEAMERQSAPRLRLFAAGSSGAGENKRDFGFEIQNTGAACSEVYVFAKERTVRTRPLLNMGERIDFTIQHALDCNTLYDVKVHYLDARRQTGMLVFSVAIQGSSISIMGDGHPRPDVDGGPAGQREIRPLRDKA